MTRIMMFIVPLIFPAIVGIAILAAVFGIGYAIGTVPSTETDSHPTYHCDGSDTVGYPSPGTPAAAACWIEFPSDMRRERS